MMRAPNRKPGPAPAVGTRPREAAPVIRIVLFEHQFADVVADGLTFQEADVVVWFQGTEVARHHVASVTALELTSDGVLKQPRRPRGVRPRRRSIPLMLPRPWGAA